MYDVNFCVLLIVVTYHVKEALVSRMAVDAVTRAIVTFDVVTIMMQVSPSCKFRPYCSPITLPASMLSVMTKF